MENTDYCQMQIFLDPGLDPRSCKIGRQFLFKFTQELRLYDLLFCYKPERQTVSVPLANDFLDELFVVGSGMGIALYDNNELNYTIIRLFSRMNITFLK